ncbi:MAG: ArsR family transcriptional regulator [Methanothrix sp.]|jgi:predicted transcriptional regulator|nr:ArsR family transcriptional regulator [Methanothrix sp.]HOI69933.1 ArsR family transcriptional regulator [Methanothrix sp.]
MKEGTLKALDEDDVEFVEILQSLGMQRAVAVVITYISKAGEATSKEIEEAAQLSQSEVSIAVQDLRVEEWIDERTAQPRGKGRPPVVYSLRTPVGEIIKQLEEEKLREYADVMEDIRRLKGLA